MSGKDDSRFFKIVVKLQGQNCTLEEKYERITHIEVTKSYQYKCNIIIRIKNNWSECLKQNVFRKTKQRWEPDFRNW